MTIGSAQRLYKELDDAEFVFALAEVCNEFADEWTARAIAESQAPNINFVEVARDGARATVWKEVVVKLGQKVEARLK